MQIAFWCEEAWQSGIVGNLVGIAYMLAERYAYQGLITQTKFACPDFDYALIPEIKRMQVKEDFSYYHETGLDAVLNEAALHVQSRERMKEHSIELKQNKLYYLPGTYKSNKEVFEHSLCVNLDRLFPVFEDFGDITFFDCSAGSGPVTQRLMEKADLVVVNLSQNPAAINRFFETEHSFLEKSVFLIGQYDSESRHNLNNIRRRYRLSADMIEAVPYNTNYLDSISDGKAVPFLEQNIECKRKDANYEFIKGLERAGSMIAARIEEYEKNS